MDEIIKALEERANVKKEFISQKKYLDVIESILGKNIDTDLYKEPVEWTEDVDLLFDFIYSNASEVAIFNECFDGTIYVKYKDNYLSLFEIHGQGCYRRISTLESEPVDFVDFDDIVAFAESGVKPERTEILEVVGLALDSMELFSQGLNLGIDIEYVRNYLIENLN